MRVVLAQHGTTHRPSRGKQVLPTARGTQASCDESKTQGPGLGCGTETLIIIYHFLQGQSVPDDDNQYQILVLINTI